MGGKTVVTLGDVPLAGSGVITWRFTTGTAPFVATMSVHDSYWDRLKEKIGQDVALVIVDSRGVRTVVQKLSILHVVPSAAPHLVTFLVADQRWRWPYRLVVRDYNITKKSGNRTSLGENVPVETVVTVDQYEYRRSSLNRDGYRWTAKELVADVLEEVIGEPEGSAWVIDSFPIQDGGGGGGREAGQLSIQNVSVRDGGDAAISRALAYVPGAEVWVDADGVVRVIDATDLQAADEHMGKLPPSTWDGEVGTLVDRAAIRPSSVLVHYQREVECMFTLDQDMGDTISPPNRDEAYLENVIPTVDPETTITDYDPETGRLLRRVVPPGTWVEARQWLGAMDAIRPTGVPWSWEVISAFWLTGDLDGALGVRADTSEVANVAARVGAFKQHFRQTYRINRRFMHRVADIREVRVGLLDPVTGARSPAAVWSQVCVRASNKGLRMPSRLNPDRALLWTNVSHLPSGSEPIIKSIPGPASVSIMDHDLGIFRVDWLTSVYGTEADIVPSHVVDRSYGLAVPTRDLAQQDTRPMGPGMRRQGAATGLYLSRTLEMHVCMTIVPAAPNNARQCHRERVEARDIAELFRTEFRIQDGDGPEMHVYVPPTEATARFGWSTDDATARETISRLLGMRSDDPRDAGIDGPELPGFVAANNSGQGAVENELGHHARSVAAEVLAQFADARQGRIATVVPVDDHGAADIRVVGNMGGAAITVAAAPSAKVVAVHDFVGQQRTLSRMAMLPESVRHLVLGTLTVGIRP